MSPQDERSLYSSICDTTPQPEHASQLSSPPLLFSRSLANGVDRPFSTAMTRRVPTIRWALKKSPSRALHQMYVPGTPLGVRPEANGFPFHLCGIWAQLSLISIAIRCLGRPAPLRSGTNPCGAARNAQRSIFPEESRAEYFRPGWPAYLRRG